MSVRALTRDVLRAFRENDLANFASAIAFRIVLALVPFLLFLLALLGFVDLEEVWRTDVAPELKKNASDVAFKLIDDTVRQVLSEKQLWWLTAGLALTLWELSAATRVTMAALDRMFGYQRRRGLVVRFGPAARQSAPWVSFGTGLVLASWVLTSIAFGLYASYVASYTSVFGHLASIFVLLLYVWLSANAFLVGIQLDACVRERA